MGFSWAEATGILNTVLTGGVNLVAPQIEQATGWDLNLNNSPVFRDYVQPAANMVGDFLGYGPAGDYLSGTSQAVAGKVPLPPAWTGGQQLPADYMDKLLAGKPAAPPVVVYLPPKAAPTAQQQRALLLARAGYRGNVWPRHYLKLQQQGA
jgi:hypothetical protein